MSDFRFSIFDSRFSANGRAGRGGFTLVELMVAVFVTGIMILAVARIFATATEAVGKGMALSEILGNSRVIGDQIERDFDQMIGPREGGVLVIVNHTVNTAIVPDDVDAGDNFDVRSDQVMFIRNRGDAEPMAPGKNDTYSNSSTANYIRAWFGHALRTDVDGSSPTDDLGTSPNQHAAKWILARQALFLQSGSGSPIHANGGTVDADVVGYDGSIGPDKKLYAGITDVAFYGLTTENASNGAMVGQSEDASADNADLRLWVTQSDGTTAFSAEDYRDRAYDYLFLNQRLLCNPVPASRDFESWQIAQMHPYLAGTVSDFIVEFAGDYDATDGIDEEESDGSIKWYSEDNMPPATGFNAGGQSPISDESPTPANADTAFVFRHGPGQTNWPYLIRIRYRLHDARGEIANQDGELGRWFEQIMVVNREG